MVNLQAYLNQFSLNAHSLKHIPDIPFLIFVSFFAFFALYFFIQWVKNFKKARSIEDTPTATLRAAAQGYVEIEGKQGYVNKVHTIAPLSRLPCTWYRYTIDHGVKDKWYRLEQGQSTHYFMIMDETGSAIVDPKGAQVTCALKDHWHGFNKYPNGKPGNIFWRILSSFGNYRYTEWRMQEEDYVYVAGNFSTKHDATTHESYNLISQNGVDKSPFLISSVDQKKLIKKYKMAATGFLFGYIVLLFIIAWLLVGKYF